VEIRLPQSIRIEIEDPSQTAEARRAARKMALNMGFDESRAEEVAIVVTEACTNLLNHATRGEILLSASDGRPTRDLECLAIDRGPGMSNLEQCLTDGYSTSATAGEGLGAIRRLSNASDFYSVPGKGTLLLACWSPEPAAAEHPDSMPRLKIGAVSVCKRGEEVCGDSWGAEQTDETSTILVADGLGHGYEASVASREAVRMLRAHAELTPMQLLERVHQALRSSRGAAVAVARIDRVRGKLTFCGVGNVSAQIHAGSRAGQHLVSVNGTAGHQTQRIREFSYPWPRNGMLVLHSDGLTTATGIEAQPAVALRDPSLIAGVLYRDFSRGQDDATVVVAREA
jgi:anti-sigma regulatory factor (Ser/Thr protein kinase)